MDRRGKTTYTLHIWRTIRGYWEFRLFKSLAIARLVARQIEKHDPWFLDQTTRMGYNKAYREMKLREEARDRIEAEELD